jgi:hypothetical protein
MDLELLYEASHRGDANGRKRVFVDEPASPDDGIRDEQTIFPFEFDLDEVGAKLPGPDVVAIGSFHEWCMHKFRYYVAQMISGRRVSNQDEMTWLRQVLCDQHMPWKFSCQEIYVYMKSKPTYEAYIETFLSAWEESGRAVVIDDDDESSASSTTSSAAAIAARPRVGSAEAFDSSVSFIEHTRSQSFPRTQLLMSAAISDDDDDDAEAYDGVDSVDGAGVCDSSLEEDDDADDDDADDDGGGHDDDYL